MRGAEGVQRTIWQCVDPAGGVYCSVEDEGRVTRTKTRMHEDSPKTFALNMSNDSLFLSKNAIQTKTAIVLVRDGKLVCISATALRVAKGVVCGLSHLSPKFEIEPNLE